MNFIRFFLKNICTYYRNPQNTALPRNLRTIMTPHFPLSTIFQPPSHTQILWKPTYLTQKKIKDT